MKRVDEARVIKIAESPSGGGANASNSPATAGGVSVTLANPGSAAAPAAGPQIPQAAQSVSVTATAATTAATTIFPTRLITTAEMPQQPLPSGATPPAGTVPPPPAAVVQAPITTQPPVSVANFTHVMPRVSSNSVSVYRNDGVAITAVAAPSAAVNATPPAAHSGSTIAASNLHQTNQPVVTQPPSNLTPETIALPTTPVSVQYATNFQSSLKTLSSTPAGTSSVVSAQSIVQSLQSQAHHQQVVHQKTAHQTVTYGPPGIRPITGATLPTVPNPVSVSTNPPPAVSVSGGGNTPAAAGGAVGQGSAQFQRLKVEDALSYLDQVKYKFGNQPQVYNDFLDIMKEFKSQTIDTPGVITRVSLLFKGHPELIVGFNTFLPPGYKIEVTCNDSNVPPGPPGLLGSNMQTIVHTPHGVHTMSAHGNMSALHPSVAAATAAQLPQTPQAPASTAVASVVAAAAAAAAGTTVNAGGATVRPVPIGGPVGLATQQPKFSQIKSENLHLPTQPAPAHLQAANFVTTAPMHGPPSGLHLNNNAGAQNAANSGANQPVEFNHAITYVNKIKNRFQGQPEVYKQFLEILHTYQKDQKAIKEGNPPSARHLTEAEVYAQVSKLFQNQEDLLSEFGQFLPEATNDSSQNNLVNSGGKGAKKVSAMSGLGTYKPYPTMLGVGAQGGLPGAAKYPGQMIGGANASSLGIGKRPPGAMVHPPSKKPKLGAASSGMLRDVSLAEAGKYGTLNEFAFFDKVRKALRSPECYNSFLRCLVLFNQEIISRQELVQISAPFLNKHPDLFKWFKDFVGFKDGIGAGGLSQLSSSSSGLGHLPPGRGDRGSAGDSSMEIDYATCKRLGASYCALPSGFVPPKCAGRSGLCKEVLNDTWVSFPSWSEDSQFVTSRKTQFEEFVYRTEDERFEFDVVLETNKDTIKVLECVQKKMSRMPPEEAARYKLDDCLGGSSPTIHQRAIRRIYGDKANDIIDGLKRNPVVAVPLVLRRLKSKDDEWRDVQKTFNKVWREQNEKYYLKSLDHQGLMFKQSDLRTLRSKSLLTEIETLYDERHEQQDEAASGDAVPAGPHLTLEYDPDDARILEDANNLLIHHVKRQTSTHKEDKHKIKVLLKHFLLDLFKKQRQELSEDEREDEDEEDKEDGQEEDSSDKDNGGSKSTRAERARKKKEEKKEGSNGKASSGSSSSNSDAKGSKDGGDKEDKDKKEITEADIKVEQHDGRRTPLHARDMEAGETYTLMMCSNNWYLFLRLHNILCERLSKMYHQAMVIINEEIKDRGGRKESTAVALRLKPKSEMEPEEYYPAFLEMVKNVLDGNMEPQVYEDTLREMFGIHAYMSFTLDKVVGYAVRQLQFLVTDEGSAECHDLFNRESKAGATGGPCSTAFDRLVPELIYQKRAERVLADENCMKVFFYHQSQKVTIEMLDGETESQNSEQEGDEGNRKWQTYVDRFIQPGETVSDECKVALTKWPVFLPRGVRSYSKSPYGKKQVERFRLAAEAGATRREMMLSSRKEEEEEQEEAKDGDKTNETKEGEAKSASRLNNGVIHHDNTQCQFDRKSLKMLYVINSESCFYRSQSLTRAKNSHKRVCRRKTADLSRWHDKWVSSHVSRTQQASFDEWFMGMSDGLVANKTVRVVRDDPDKVPYRKLTKYKTEIVASGLAAAAAAAAAPAADSKAQMQEP